MTRSLGVAALRTGGCRFVLVSHLAHAFPSMCCAMRPRLTSTAPASVVARGSQRGGHWPCAACGGGAGCARGRGCMRVQRADFLTAVQNPPQTRASGAATPALSPEASAA